MDGRARIAAPIGLAVFDTALGPCGIAWTNGTIVGAQLPEDDPLRTLQRLGSRWPEALEAEPDAIAADAIARIRALLGGALDDLRSIPLALDAVPAFSRDVYEATRAVGPGCTSTYGAIARAIGAPLASRAVGAALAANPFAPIVPCHRVLAAGGRPGGFSAHGGERTKRRMLAIEAAAHAAATPFELRG